MNNQYNMMRMEIYNSCARDKFRSRFVGQCSRSTSQMFEFIHWFETRTQTVIFQIKICFKETFSLFKFWSPTKVLHYKICICTLFKDTHLACSVTLITKRHHDRRCLMTLICMTARSEENVPMSIFDILAASIESIK